MKTLKTRQAPTTANENTDFMLPKAAAPGAAIAEIIINTVNTNITGIKVKLQVNMLSAY
ncbi:MAG TPA: hypothetical protein PK753_15230 [Ignavibacteria bacterium]|mgnify:CR=1 FL=1|nr:hypothetical protein [Ignavibacteria bacterium]